MKNSQNIYIPEKHKKYNLLPNHQKWNEEIFIFDNDLLMKIEKHTGMNNLYPYYRYKTYQNFYKEIDEWIKKYPEIKKEIIDYKNSIIKLNNKDDWAIVQYIGTSNWRFTNHNFYYIVMYTENDCWKVYGIVDNEEYNAFEGWSNKCTAPIDLLKDLKIIIDPSNILKEEFIKIMKKL